MSLGATSVYQFILNRQFCLILCHTTWAILFDYPLEGYLLPTLEEFFMSKYELQSLKEGEPY